MLRNTKNKASKKGKQKGGSNMNLEQSVKAMIISEYPLDSVIASSRQSKDARKGILEYVRYEKPDVIFVDGLISRIRFPESYAEGIIESDPLKRFMDTPFKLASKFLRELKEANPQSEIYLAFSDADEDNIRRLTKHMAKKEVNKNKEKIKECKLEIQTIKEGIKKARGKKRLNLQRRLGGYQSKLKNIQTKSLLKTPIQESLEWNDFKSRTSKAYKRRLQELCPGIHVHMGTISTEIKGFTFEYTHNFHKASDIPLASRTNKLMSYVDKLHMGNVPLPNFIIESGHHAETMSHPYKHGNQDVYSLIHTGMVMEDQKIVNGILKGNFKPEIFQGKVNKIEACKRQSKKIPAPGISIIGYTPSKGYFTNLYSLAHLANVGKGKTKVEDMDFETITVLSDIHVGKGAVKYELLESAIEKLIKQIKKRKESGLSAPILFMLNESLQGANYKTYFTETTRKLPSELRESLEDIVSNYETRREKGKTYVDANAITKIIETAVREHESINEPSLGQQTKWYHELTKKLIPLTLLYCEYELGVLFAEGTHIAHTVGEYGIKEVDLQSLVYEVLDMMIPTLIEAGELREDTQLKRIKNKIKKGTHMKFDLKLGDVNYNISAVHKPGGAGPSSNIPNKHIQRAITMSDDADMFFSAHLHTPYFFAIGRMESNDISSFYKGATFNDYDSYGKAGGWSPAVVGYQQALVPKNKNGKGVYKVQFILSDVLK